MTRIEAIKHLMVVLLFILAGTFQKYGSLAFKNGDSLIETLLIVFLASTIGVIISVASNFLRNNNFRSR